METQDLNHNVQQHSKSSFWLKNVRLETGFERDDNDQVIHTTTDVFDLEIVDGIIKQLKNHPTTISKDAKVIDAKGLLLLPPMKDMHVHIDKTFYGGNWRAAPWEGGIKDMIKLEEKLIPELLPSSQERAEKCIQLLQSYGSTFARCHCNIDPVSGLKSLEHLQRALENFKEEFSWEIVAFPQHGILHSDSENLLREAAQMNVDFIGGLDPTVVDGDMTKSLDIMFDIALEYDKGVDIHLHEDLSTGKAVMEYMLERVKDNKRLQGNTFISHAYALSQMDEKSLEDMSNQFAEYGIGIVSRIPMGKQLLPIPTLQKHGVIIKAGTDNIMDNFSPFGSGDMLEKAKLCAQLYGWTNEYHLNRALQFATDNVMPLDNAGKQVWPREGSPASFTLVNASCSAEAVARLPRRESVYYNGRQIFSQ
ncbi:amidohydrolase [Nonlabens antarcticus]|uniref:amidohydrolase n=1 Tax=Nonlabens antarcticus TaxID=392714 RepID=UPI001E430702|nr:amidohydrolase [Nonlabens antarcticus]